MSPKWLIGILIMFLMCTIFSGIMEATYLGSEEASVFERLLFVEALTTGSAWEGIQNIFVGVFSAPLQFMGALWDVFTFDYAMYTGDYIIVRFLLLTITIALVVSLTLAWIRGVSSG